MYIIVHNDKMLRLAQTIRTKFCSLKTPPDISRWTDDNPRNPQIMYSILSTGEKNGPLGKLT
jgi:hypothetical protein